MTHPDMGAAAQWYAEQGVPVLPLQWPIPVGDTYRCSCGERDCSSPAKHPLGHLTPRGLADATTDPGTVARWWQAHPRANIGLRTGVVFDVIDVDGPAGRGAYAELCRTLGGRDVEALAVVRTGRPDGGRQHYVIPPHARNHTGGRAGIPRGVDVRGAGGYVVAVPSLHISGRPYEWIARWGDPDDSGDVPWTVFYQRLTAGAPAAALGVVEAPRAAPPRAAPGEISPYALKALTGEVDAVRLTPEGSRNAQLNESAFAIGQLVSHGLIDDATARGALTDAARAAGLDPREINKTISSGFAGGAAKPRQALPADPVPGIEKPASLGQTPPATGHQDDDHGGPVAGEQPAGDVEGTDLVPAVDLDALALAHETRQLRIRRQARAALDAEEAAAAFPWPVHLPTLTADLAEPDEQDPFTIDQMMPAGANVLLMAQFKAGKTTLINNAACSLAEQTPFLNRFKINDHPGRVVIFNYEMSTGQYRRWWRDLECTATDRITLVHLRGIRVPLLAPVAQDWIIATLQDCECETWIIDPFAPAFAGSGDENSNSDVAQVLDILDTIKTAAGVPNLILATHTGRATADRAGERARGATRLDDWADARWVLTLDGSARFLRAAGRDVDVAQERLTVDTRTRRLTFSGGDVSWERRRAFEAEILNYVTANPGCSVRDIHQAVTGKRDAIDAARIRLAQSGMIRLETDGVTGKHLHYLSARDTLRN